MRAPAQSALNPGSVLWLVDQDRPDPADGSSAHYGEVVFGMTLREGFLLTLQGNFRTRFLLNLEYEFSMLERFLYRSGRGMANPISLVAYCNESRIVVQKQVRADILGASNGYPDEALEAILSEKAQRAGCMDSWSGLVTRAAPWLQA